MCLKSVSLVSALDIPKKIATLGEKKKIATLSRKKLIFMILQKYHVSLNFLIFIVLLRLIKEI